MPILPPEPDVFPDDLFEEENLEQAGEEPWWAIYTLPRREKEIVRQLRRREIGHYCPLIQKRSRSPNGRVRTSYIPLFASYVFVRGSEESRYQALTTNCVSRVLDVPDPERLVRDLRQIWRLVASKARLTPEERLQPGMRVRVRSGALQGLEGTVIRRRGGERLLVEMAFLQQGASIQLEHFDVERIDA